MATLDQELIRIADTSVLLVAADFDGTLAPIVDRPDDATAIEGALEALARLSELPETRVAVVSGRALHDLSARLGDVPEAIDLVGSHGAEFSRQPPGNGVGLTDSEEELARAIRTAVEDAAMGLDGVVAEHKGVSSALHYRRATRTAAAEALLRLCRRRRTHPLKQAHARRGKKVVELFAVHASKGLALEQLRIVAAATGTLYVGDDRTDEDAFRVLGESDVGVKVGPGPTIATQRVWSPGAVAGMLLRLADARSIAKSQGP